MRACVCSNCISVMINEKSIIKFQGKRGLCQGDPLSPFIYLIVAKEFVSLMCNACALDCFHSLKLFEEFQFNLLQFAYDTILFEKVAWGN